MNQFSQDVKLLADLSALIEHTKKQAKPPAFVGAFLGSFSPLLKDALPFAQESAKKELDILTRAKERLEELIEEEQHG